MNLLLSNFQVDEMSDNEGADDAWTKFADIESNARLRNEVEFFMQNAVPAMPVRRHSDSSAETSASKSGSTEEKSGAASGGENGAEFTGAGGIEDTGLENESCGPGLILAGRCGRSLPNGRAQAHPDRLPPPVSPLGLRSMACPSTPPHELEKVAATATGGSDMSGAVAVSAAIAGASADWNLVAAATKRQGGDLVTAAFTPTGGPIGGIKFSRGA